MCFWPPCDISYIRLFLQDWERLSICLVHGEPVKIWKQKNMFQMKQQERASERNLNKMEIIIYLPGKDFKVMVIKLLTKLKRRTNE